MNLFDSLVAALPIALLVFWMTKRPGMPSNRALPLAALLLYILLLAWFRVSPWLVHAAVVEGLLTALTPVLIVAGAILLFKTMEHSGAMATVRDWLNGITTNHVAQLMILGWSFSFLIEGVSGFGTPAALAAPLLVGLGFRPLPVAVLCLVMNTVPVSFGAVGMPTWFGFGNLDLSPEEMREIGVKSALIHAGAALVIPLLALRMVVSTREIRRNLGYIALVVGATMAVYVATAHFSVEFPTVVGGSVGLVVATALARWGIGLAAEGEARRSPRIAMPRLLKATFPLWATVLILIATRMEVLGLKGWLTADAPFQRLPLASFGELRVSPSFVVQWRQILGSELVWSHAVLYVPSLLPFVLVSFLTFALYRSPRAAVATAWRQSASQVLKPLGAFLGALVFVRLFMVNGNDSCAALLGRGLAQVGGDVWQFSAVYLGALGAFFSGSNTVSNLTFGSIQDATAATLGLSRTTILSLQSVGGAMGTMMCIHNIVAVCSVLGLHDEEGHILRQTLLPTLIYGVIAGLVSLMW